LKIVAFSSAENNNFLGTLETKNDYKNTATQTISHFLSKRLIQDITIIHLIKYM